MVRSMHDRAVLEFLEKPDEVDTTEQLVSAGAYVLERSMLDLIEPGRAVSIEREMWPALVGQRALRPCRERLLDGHRDARALPPGDLRHHHRRGRTDGARRGTGAHRDRRGLEIDAGAQIGPLVVLGDRVRVGEDAAIERAVVLAGAEIGAALRAP